MNGMDSPHTQITCKVPAALLERLDEIARYHGRSRSAELRVALSMHDCGSTLAYLMTSEAEAELSEGEIEQARETVKADLEELGRKAYGRPMLRPPSGPELN